MVLNPPDDSENYVDEFDVYMTEPDEDEPYYEEFCY